MRKYCCGVKCIYVGGGVNVQQFRDGVHGEDVCFPLFHCFFEMCVIPKCLLKFNF